MFQFLKRYSILATATLGTAISLASMTIAKETAIQMPMVEDAAIGGIKSSRGGTTNIAAFVTNFKGKAMVCGFWNVGNRISARSKSSNMFRKGMQTSSVRYKNKILVRDLTFMNEVSDKNYVTGAKANCKLSKHTWNPAMTNESINIHVMRRTIH
ncbi:hypothetical protein ROA7450_02985 [Roseovarius albus]|uniref:Uncharacterized protein n=1 Tax=Roseovarius albus TaxID=1247867 RepID=A0A1X6ZP35_9RHOB|nr:hypothetical protein [Roseovarius albus]SLN57363.1 hypothetical protein ROA7450_02985 [Roseovarius albus]